MANYNMSRIGRDPGSCRISTTTGLPIAQYRYFYHDDGSVSVLFRNDRTGEEKVKHYKTQSIAQGQITRFVNRMTRIYTSIH